LRRTAEFVPIRLIADGKEFFRERSNAGLARAVKNSVTTRETDSFQPRAPFVDC
jgi:hypothetical protein